MANLLDIWPGYQKLINEPDSWTKYTPAERKLKYWAGYQLAMQKYPQFKAMSQEQFLNDPYTAFQNVDRYIQKPTANGIPDPNVEPLTTKAANYAAPVVKTEQPVTQIVGATPQQPISAADALAGTGTTSPDMAAGQPRGTGNIKGYDANGNPIYEYNADGTANNATVVYHSTDEFEQAKKEQNDQVTRATVTNAQMGGDVSGSGATQSLNDASWYYGTGADFAKYGNFPYAAEDEGGRTWKPGVNLGQEAQNRYLAGDQFFQWLPNAFQAATQAVPQSVPTPTWSSFSQGLTGPGMWAAGYPQNINVGGNAFQTGQAQQGQQAQGAQFSPYNTTAPYGFSQQQYNKQQFQTPWYSGLSQTPSQAGTQTTGGPSIAGTTTTDQGGPSLAAVKQKADPNAPPITTWPLSNRSQMNTPQGVNNQAAGQPQSYASAFSNVGNQALGSNQYGQSTVNQLRGLANPNYYQAPTNTYGSQNLRNTTQAYAQNPAMGAGGRAQATEGAVSNTVAGQLNQNLRNDPLYGQARTQLSSQLGAGSPVNAITQQIQNSLGPVDVYNKQLQDTLYADQTRRLDEDYTKQLQDTQDYYNFYGLSGSSAEKKQMDLLKQNVDRQKQDISNTLNAQMIQKAQTLEGQRLGNLTGALTGVSGTQQQAINSAMGLMDLPAAQQRAAAGLGLGLLGQQQSGAQNEYGNLMAALAEAQGAQGQAANISLGAAGQNFANTGQQANILGSLANLGMQGYGAGSDTSQWLTNYFDQLAQTQRANAAQDYTMATQESATQQQQQQQNYQNLLQLLGVGTGLYDTTGTQGWNQMRLTATDLANLSQNWNQQAAANLASNNWWQPLLGGLASTASAAAGAPRYYS